MTDVFDTEKRSAVMRAVKSRDTGPELKVRRAAHAAGKPALKIASSRPEVY